MTAADRVRALGPGVVISHERMSGLVAKHPRHIGEFLDLYPAATKGGEAEHAIQS